MRARNLKPGFFYNEALVELPALTRLLFQGLWCLADREGRLEDRPKKIKMAVLPADSVDVDKALQTLHDAELIVRYEVEGSAYIFIPSFLKHQKPHPKEAKSVIPSPPKQYLGNTQTQPKHNPGTIKDLASPAESPFLESSTLVEEEEKEERTHAREGDYTQDEIDAFRVSAVAYCQANLSAMTAGNYNELEQYQSEGVADEVICFAIDEAAAQNARSWGYVRTILENWLKKGVRTVGDARAAQDEHRQKKSQRAPPAKLNIGDKDAYGRIWDGMRYVIHDGKGAFG